MNLWFDEFDFLVLVTFCFFSRAFHDSIKYGCLRSLLYRRHYVLKYCRSYNSFCRAHKLSWALYNTEVVSVKAEAAVAVSCICLSCVFDETQIERIKTFFFGCYRFNHFSGIELFFDKKELNRVISWKSTAKNRQNEKNQQDTHTKITLASYVVRAQILSLSLSSEQHFREIDIKRVVNCVPFGYSVQWMAV